MRHTVEPGLLRSFRYFVLIALFYYAAIVLFTMLQTGQGVLSVLPQWYMNFFNNIALSIYLSLPAFQKRMGKYFLPFGLTLSAGIPMLTNLMRVIPHISQMPWDVDPTWITFPNLLVTVVLIAWQYSFHSVLLFTVTAAIIEEIAVFAIVGGIGIHTLPVLGLPLLRAFSFGLTGHIVSRVMVTQRAQRRELLRANIQLSQHAAALEQLTVSHERNRMARELHDILAHTLSGQAVNLEAIKLSLEPNQLEAKGMLDQTLKLTREGLSEVRRAIEDLRSQPLEELGLVLALERLATEAAARAGLVAAIKLPEISPVLNARVEHATYRVAQEAIANVVRHAKAKNVRLSLDLNGNQMILTISDDGLGFGLISAVPLKRHGLDGMEERAREVGGTLSIESQHGNGTTIQLRVEALNDQRIDM